MLCGTIDDSLICKFQDYELKTLSMIRGLGTRLNVLSDEKIADLYREWSVVETCTMWLAPSEGAIKQFCEWATIAPCDKK